MTIPIEFSGGEKIPVSILAAALGRLAAGKPKIYSPAEIAKRKARLNRYRHRRWPKKQE
jgi:hypothetical protein